ncbi:MAG TPA: N-acetyltransferase [Actinomycetota bacterium]|jgi:predicted N-acetyltransferase YhbS
MMAIRREIDRDREASLEVERLAFSSGRDGGPADDIVTAIRAIREEPDSFALVAELDGEIVGHAQFSRAWVGESSVALLGPIGVHPDHQRRGVGSRLVRAGLHEAGVRGEPAVILLGDPAYYGRFGFVAASTFGLRNPAAGGPRTNGLVILEEHFQIAPLDDRARSLAGTVRWHEAL